MAQVRSLNTLKRALESSPPASVTTAVSLSLVQVPLTEFPTSCSPPQRVLVSVSDRGRAPAGDIWRSALGALIPLIRNTVPVLLPAEDGT